MFKLSSRNKAICTVAALLSWSLPLAAQAADITVSVSGITSKEGKVNIALFGPNGNFPRPEAVLKGGRVDLTSDPATGLINGKVSFVFKNLAPGEYAVASYHDRNNNGKRDRGAKEAIGFSNDAKIFLGPPDFKDAAFALGQENITVDVKLVD